MERRGLWNKKDCFPSCGSLSTLASKMTLILYILFSIFEKYTIYWPVYIFLSLNSFVLWVSSLFCFFVKKMVFKKLTCLGSPLSVGEFLFSTDESITCHRHVFCTLVVCHSTVIIAEFLLIQFKCFLFSETFLTWVFSILSAHDILCEYSTFKTCFLRASYIHALFWVLRIYQ